jgi:hypothetical protein
MKALIETRFANEESIREIYRVLRPGAAFGVIWNVEDCKFDCVYEICLATGLDMAR